MCQVTLNKLRNWLARAVHSSTSHRYHGSVTHDGRSEQEAAAVAAFVVACLDFQLPSLDLFACNIPFYEVAH